MLTELEEADLESEVASLKSALFALQQEVKATKVASSYLWFYSMYWA